MSPGLHFVTAFPENIAHYHPSYGSNKIEVTSLQDNAGIIVSTFKGNITATMMKGEVKIFPVPGELELQRNTISSNILQIRSDKPIIARTFNRKDQSIQTSLLKASDKFGKLYKIPPMPSKIAEQSLSPSEVPEAAPFTVIVINNGAENNVKWKGDTVVMQEVSLQPFNLAQFWMSKDVTYEVEATEPVSVLFGHPCATVFNCTCGMLVTPLDPVSWTKLNFFIPPDFMTNNEDEASLLIADQGSPLPYDPNHPTVKSVGSVVFHRPGLLLNIIPEEDFSTGFLINNDPSLEPLSAYAVVVVDKNQRDLVHHGSETLSGSDWNDINTTNYVSKTVPLIENENVFWHPKAMMAVYHMGSIGTMMYGNPAPIISKDTSLGGSVLTPEVVNMGDVAMGWRESIQFCKDLGLDLASMDGTDMRFLAPKLHAMNKSLKQVWIGFRRSSLTGEWYRLSKTKIENTHWGEGEPGEPEEGQCAMMSLDPDKDFGWSDESCCTAAVPLCYKDPILLK
ncbi:hypothetical protein NHX12_002114 [Muraenolepis orangiensis]|uniref:C-type lectin domain-containing protein n=1 Tax=Muraenolepis orangiensis TaxID=630683 RepID=A0A9Q0I4E7_9TELE|nr:hypothetical protein NHX12_034136 [Muraenolepis orangiensis]KAJ3598608.1 hypothetical protein NHX12_002114 [Muraenolepis orangiensis]